MKRALLLPLLGVLAACGTDVAQNVPVPTTQTQQVTTTTSAAPTVPPAPQPATDGACPYLATGFVAEANGQRVPKVKLCLTPNSPVGVLLIRFTAPPVVLRPYNVPCGPRSTSTRSISARSKVEA